MYPAGYVLVARNRAPSHLPIMVQPTIRTDHTAGLIILTVEMARPGDCPNPFHQTLFAHGFFFTLPHVSILPAISADSMLSAKALRAPQAPRLGPSAGPPPTMYSWLTPELWSPVRRWRSKPAIKTALAHE